MKTMRFRGWNCEIRKAEYENGNLALLLVDADNGEPIAKASVNPPDDDCLSDGEIAVKDYSENAGMLQALLDAGIVEETGREIRLSPWVTAPICRVLI